MTFEAVPGDKPCVHRAAAPTRQSIQPPRNTANHPETPPTTANHTPLTMSCEECGVRKNLYGLKWHVSGGSGRICSTCHSHESQWPSTIASLGAAGVAAKLASMPDHMVHKSARGEFDGPAVWSCPRCGGSCRSPMPGGSFGALCCTCAGRGAECSLHAGRGMLREVASVSGAAAGATMAAALQTLTGVDGSSIDLTSSQVTSREARLRASVLEPAFHQTSADGVKGIVSSGKMTRGSSGIAGGGIYFARDAADTFHKAHATGFVLRARVKLGAVDSWGSSEVHYGMTFSELQAKSPPKDSVHIPRPGGDEYVVYCSDQVEVLDVRKVEVTDASSHPVGWRYVGDWLSTASLRASPAALDALVTGTHPDTVASELSHRGGGGASSAAGAGSSGY